MEYSSNSPDQAPVSDVRRAAFARHAVNLTEAFGTYNQERTNLSRIESETSTEIGVLERVTVNSEAIFAVDGAYVSLQTEQETTSYIDPSKPAANRESVTMQVATPLIYDNVTYWSVEMYRMRPELGRYEDLLYSDEVDAEGRWKQYIPADIYEHPPRGRKNEDEAGRAARQAREARTVLTFSHYRRAESILNKLEESYLYPEVPEIFIPRTFKLEKMEPLT